MSGTVHHYLTLNPGQRDSVRTAVRYLAVRSGEHYAELLAAEAGLAARTAYPDTARLVFSLGEDITGPTATLVAAYTRDGTQLWHVDQDDEWPDESRVTGLLAAAADWLDGYHPFSDAPENADLEEYQLSGVDQPGPDQLSAESSSGTFSRRR
jgi:hypothetical protein